MEQNLNEHHAHIDLPVAAVHRAWGRYIGYGGSEAGEDELMWRADDGSGLTATFVSDGPRATTIIARREAELPALPDAPAPSLAEFIDGFLTYVNAAFAELSASPGKTEGMALAGPDGTAHMLVQASGLGTDSSEANVATARHSEQSASGG